MIRSLPGEKWLPLLFSGWKKLRNCYAISSHGRMASYQTDPLADGKLLKGSVTTGYRTLNLHRPGEKGTIYLHRELARVFLTRPSRRHQYVIHLNHRKTDNHIRNLRWVTTDEMIRHQQQSPAKKAYRLKQANRNVGLKLTAAQVKKIKSILRQPNRRITIKKIAEQYGVSEMTLYRIRSGENWGRVS